MLETWVIFALAYGILKGVRELLKKKAMEKTDRTQVLYFYIVLSFLFVIPFTSRCINVNPLFLLPIAGKSLVLFFAWIFSFSAIEKLPISTYGVLDLSRVIFSTVLSIIFLSESVTIYRLFGLVLVLLGLLLLTRIHDNTRESEKNVSIKFVILAIASCFFNSVSAIIDKVALSTSLTDIQMLYWYLAFLVVLYSAYMLFSKKKVQVSTLKNTYIWVLSAVFVFAEWCIFRANVYRNSLVSVMTLIKQSSCIVTILGGRVIFKEQRIVRKLICAIIVVGGIAISVL